MTNAHQAQSPTPPPPKEVEWYVAQAHAEYLEVLKGLKEFGVLTIRSLVLLNGGAIITLLAFLSALHAKALDQGAGASIARALATDIRPSLWWFGCGLLAAVTASASAYLNFASLQGTFQGASDLYHWAKGSPRMKSKMRRACSAAFAYIAIALAVAALGSFGMGADSALQALR